MYCAEESLLSFGDTMHSNNILAMIFPELVDGELFLEIINGHIIGLPIESFPCIPDYLTVAQRGLLEPFVVALFVHRKGLIFAVE